MHLGFHEGPPELRTKAARVGLGLDAAIGSGQVELLWEPPGESVIDRIAERLLAATARRDTRRVVIDGLGGLQAMALYPDRLVRFLASVLNELRADGIAVMLTVEPRDLAEGSTRIPMPGLSAIVDTVIALRYVYARATLRRLVSVLKVRDGDFDPAVHELQITGRGVDVALSAESARAVLAEAGGTGVPWLEAIP